MKKILIDCRMREIEKSCLRNMGYELEEVSKSQEVYEEISSHVDIFFSKIGNTLVIEPSKYDEYLAKNFKNIVKGKENVSSIYPDDIKYNVCMIGNHAIHNFKDTDKKIKEILEERNYHEIHVNQGYTNCSIAVIDDNSFITSDYGIYESLKDFDFDILLLRNDLEIKLLNGDKYSFKKGFIGGCISRLDNNIFVSGDLSKIDIDGDIREFIERRKLKIVDFENLDVIDYGGIIDISE